MADNTPNTPGEGVPPKPSEAKVQPKKETVRITLPPKPTASPTIKLPTLPGASPAAPPAPAPGAPAAPTAARPGTAAPPRPTAAGTKIASAPPAPRRPGVGVAAAKPTGAAPAAPRPAPAPKPAQTVSVFDRVLAIVALVVNLVAVGCLIFLMTLLDKTQSLLDEIPR